jgi:hypothetical protein
MPPAGSRRGRVRRGKLKMVEALPLRATRFNHEIAAASMAKRAGRHDFHPLRPSSSVMVNATLHRDLFAADRLFPAAFGLLIPDASSGVVGIFCVRINEI